MNEKNRSIRLMLLATACCFALVLIPVSSYAQLHSIVAQLGGVAHGVQHGVQKGAHGVQKGVEGTYNAGKDVVTGDNDQNRQQTEQQTEQQQTTPSENRMKGSQAQPGTTSTQTETETNQNQQGQTDQNQTDQTRKSHAHAAGQKQMPRTAGELPLLVMTGLLSLAGARATRRMK